MNENNGINKLAQLLNIDINTNNLYIKIQSKIKELTHENKKLKFTNVMLTNENKKIAKKIEDIKNNSDYKYLTEIKKQFDNTYDILKNENKELNGAIIGLKKEVELYKQENRELRRKLN